MIFNGDSVPIAEGGYPSAFFDVPSDKIWFSWSGATDTTTRKIYVSTYDRSKGTWAPGPASQGYLVATNTQTDSHGTPTIVKDQFGYVHVFFGAHAGNILYSYTTNPNDPSAWTSGPALTSQQFTYTYPALINGVIWIITTDSITGQNLRVVKGTPTSGGGVASWTDVGRITAFTPGTNGRTVVTNIVVSGSKIGFSYSYCPNSSAYINDVYFSWYDTVTGNLTDVSGATVIPAASLPISQATAQADFAIFLTGSTSRATIPTSAAVDSNGTVHVLYADGAISNSSTGAGTFTLLESHWTGSAWSAGSTIATITNFFLGATIVPNGSGSVDVYFPQIDTTFYDAWKSSLVAGSWTTPALVRSAQNYDLGYYQPVWNASPEARVLLSEDIGFTSGQSNVYGNLQVFAIGDSGLLRQPFYLNNNGLAAYYPFDAATTNFVTNVTQDTSGNGNNGAMSNIVSGDQVAAQIAEGLTFNGSNKTISFGNAASIKPAFPITVTGWIKLSAFDSAWSNIFHNDGGSTNIAGVSVIVRNTGALNGIYGSNTGSGSTNYFERYSNSGIVTLNTWGFFVATFNSAIQLMYNDVIVADATHGGTDGTGTTVGYSTANAGIAPWFGEDVPTGILDDLRVYNRQLAPWERTQIYESGLAGHS